MKKFLLVSALLFAGYFSFSQSLHEFESKRVRLSNGWSLTPAGKSLPLGDLPLNIAVSSSKKYIAVTNNGQSTQSLQLIDVEKEMILDNMIIPKSWLWIKVQCR